MASARAAYQRLLLDCILSNVAYYYGNGSATRGLKHVIKNMRKTEKVNGIEGAASGTGCKAKEQDARSKGAFVRALHRAVKDKLTIASIGFLTNLKLLLEIAPVAEFDYCGESAGAAFFHYRI